MWIVLWDSFLMKVLLKKKVCESHKQCMRLTDRYIPMKYLLVIEIVGPMHSAWYPLTIPCPMWNVGLNKKLKKKKKENANAAWRSVNPNAYLEFYMIFYSLRVLLLVLPLYLIIFVRKNYCWAGDFLGFS